MIALDIFSDPVCPWCYIGKANLDRALAAHPGHGLVIAWHPFQLNPDMPAGGADRAEYLAAKFGGTARAAEIYSRVERAAQDAGLNIDFAAMRRMPNTHDAHRMIYWAGLEERQDAMVTALFRAFFVDGRDIGDRDTLTELAAAAGMDGALAARLLQGDADRAAIAKRDQHARSRGVNAVPTFLLDNHYVLSGAQPAELWGQVIAELTARAPQTAPLQ